MNIRPKDYCPYQQVAKKINKIQKVTEIFKN